jgi:dolichol-phosphate mannosyltransferase
MGVLTLLARAGLTYLQAGAVAAETAIGTNFLLNEFWSFTDRACRHSGVILRVVRFLKFNLSCAESVGIALLILWLLKEYGGLHYLLSNLVGITVATAWTYGLNANHTWKAAHAERKQL